MRHCCLELPFILYSAWIVIWFYVLVLWSPRNILFQILEFNHMFESTEFCSYRPEAMPDDEWHHLFLRYFLLCSSSWQCLSRHNPKNLKSGYKHKIRIGKWISIHMTYPFRVLALHHMISKARLTAGNAGREGQRNALLNLKNLRRRAIRLSCKAGFAMQNIINSYTRIADSFIRKLIATAWQ